MLRKYIIGIVLFFIVIGTWFSIPPIILLYINGQDENIKAESAQLVSFNCIKITNLKIEKENIKGFLQSAIVCRNNKTIDINGGSLSVVINSTNSSSKNLGYNISAKNLLINFTKDNITGKLLNSNISNKVICSDISKIKTENINADLDNLCFNVVTKEFSFDSGQVSGSFKDYKFDAVLFGKSFGNKDSITSAYIVMPSIIGEEVRIYKDGLYAKSIEINNNKIWNKPITIQEAEIKPLFGDIFLSSYGVGFYLNVEDKRIFGNNNCQDWLDILPKELINNQISLVKMKGELKFDISIGESPYFKLKNSCRLSEIPLFIKQLSNNFTYIAYHPDKTKFTRTTGPRNINWTNYSDISYGVINAITTTEDPGFFKHNGFIPQAFENSLKDNLKLGKFFRGGSTVTMQLAKNLWLSRDRNIGRKIQEAILTISLESSLSKEQILELYLNVVEFGPNVYGIGRGAQEVFSKTPKELDLEESIYLCLRLPSPNRSASFENSKRKTQQIIELMLSKNKIDIDEADYYLKESY